MASSPKNSPVSGCQFLIISYGNQLQGDGAAGLEIVTAVANWRLSSVKSLCVRRLTSDLISTIVAADYVFFVSACSDKSHTRTVQLEPIVKVSERSRMPIGSYNNLPQALLTLTQQCYGKSPQAWLLRIPTNCHEAGRALSPTAQRGCDRALRMIEQFFQTYSQRPLHTDTALCA